MFTTKLHVQEIERFVRYEVYKTPMFQLQDFRARRYLVSVDIASQNFACICCKFDKDGNSMCSYSPSPSHLNISELPARYYIDRWKPKDRKYIRDKQYMPIDLTTSNKHLRYCVLSKILLNIASEGSIIDHKYSYLTDQCKNIEDRLDEMTREGEETEKLNKEKRKQPAPTEAQPHEDGYNDFLEDPDIAPSKGRPESSKRQKTFVEELFSKNKITCSHPGSHQHNIATCTKKHLPKYTKEKKGRGNNKKKPNGNYYIFRHISSLMQHITYIMQKLMTLLCIMLFTEANVGDGNETTKQSQAKPQKKTTAKTKKITSTISSL
jgi:hypothetical protein